VLLIARRVAGNFGPRQPAAVLGIFLVWIVGTTVVLARYLPRRLAGKSAARTANEDRF
jgi:hypothetical protein